MQMNMDGMKSLELTKEERKDEAPVAYDPKKDSGPTYPWGTRLSLSDPELKKMGAGAALDVGMEVMICAKAKVTSFIANEYVEDGKNEIKRTVDLQITDMMIEPMGLAKPPPAGDVLYGGSDT